MKALIITLAVLAATVSFAQDPNAAPAVDPNAPVAKSETTAPAAPTLQPQPIKTLSIGSYVIETKSLALMSMGELRDFGALLAIVQIFQGRLEPRIVDTITTKLVSKEFLLVPAPTPAGG